MKLQKITSIILAIILVFSLGITAFAATGSITINNISAGNVYEIYKLLDLESYDKESGAYSYKVNSEWTGFFATAEALNYVAIDATGYVTWKAAEDDDTVAAFAKKALAYAEANGISPVKSSSVPGDFVVTSTTGKFSGLELGYYLIDSTMGALCGLTTTNPDASINAKNGSPTIDKQVKEDSTNQWGSSNSAEVGQVVEFRVTINVHQGAQNYVLHDTMAEGLTFKEVTKIEHVIPDVETHDVSNTKYTVSEPGACGCTFEIAFNQEFCDELETNNKVIIYYSATINEKAIVGTDPVNNKAILAYGENQDHTTAEDKTETFTYDFDLVKTDSQNNLIDGAAFRIYDAENGGNEVAVVALTDDHGNVTGYRRAKDGETGTDIVVKGGQVRVYGFDNGTYYLEETITPAGYNQLTTRHKFIIADSDLNATFNDEIYSTGSGVHVVNKTGSMLPETGGIGTTLFYVVGGLLVGGAVVALVSKKRMSSK